MLRSIRYGEADRIVHLYSATRGRIGAIAKGSRRPKSRFGGRLEPFFRLDLVLYEGRGDLFTVTGASTVDGSRRGCARTGRRWGRRAGPATRCCGCSTPGRRTRPPTTCSAATWACSTPIPRRRARRARRSPSGSSWRSPRDSHPSWRAARAAGRPSTWRPSPARPGGVVCASCEGGGFPLSEEAHRFMVEALARPLSEAPGGGPAGGGAGRPGDHRDARAPRARAPARRGLVTSGRYIRSADPELIGFGATALLARMNQGKKRPGIIERLPRS